MHKQRFTRQDAVNAKNKNIIELALGFSAMTRMFAKQSDTKILDAEIYRAHYDDIMWPRIQRRVPINGNFRDSRKG